MVLFAKPVRAPKCAPKRASTSATPSDFAALSADPKSSWHWAFSSISAGIRGSHFDVVEARRAGAVTGADGLFGLPFTAIRNAPQHPMVAIGDGRARIPELGSDSAISRILQHTRSFADFDLPCDFAAELEFIAIVVNGPTAIGLHINGVADAGEHFVERLLAGQQAYVGHTDQRKTRPTGGAHGAVGTRRADGGRGFTRGHVSHELPIANNVRRLRRDAFVIKGERSHAGAVLDTRVAHSVDQIGTVAQMIQLVEREEAHARVVGL